MNLQQEIEATERKLTDLERRQNSCNHNWSDPRANHPETIQRWTRTCKTCGKEQHTSRTEVVEVKTKPVF